MGKVKLTLTVDDRIVANANLVSPVQPTALSLLGSAKGLLSRKTDRQIREMMYKDRYGL